MKQGKRSITEYWNEFRLVASKAELDDLTGGELLLGGMNTQLQDAWGASREEYEDLEALAQWAIRGKPSWRRSGISKDRHQQKTSNERTSHHETRTGHINLQIRAIRTTATPWNSRRPGDDQDSTSQGKNFKAASENNYASNAHNLDS